MFAEDDRNQIRARLLVRAREDRRVTSAAVTGSASHGAEDRWSDIDLFFGIAAEIALEEVFTVVFTSAEATADTLPAWPGRTGTGTRLIAFATLPNSQAVWLVAFEQEFSESNRQHVERNKRLLVEAARQMKEDPSEIPELRAFLYGGEDEGTHWYLDISLADMKD